MDARVVRVRPKNELAKAFAIRVRLFVREQHVPAEVEIDSDDDQGVTIFVTPGPSHRKPDDGLVRIRKVLQLAQSTGAPNLRAFQRTPVELTAVITTPKGTVETRIRDISPAGMFIEMEKMPAFAAVFPVLIQLPAGEPPLLVTVQSVRHETGASGRPAGVGVRFVGGTDEFRVRLDAFLRPDLR